MGSRQGPPRRQLALGIALLGALGLITLWLARPADDAQAPPHAALPLAAAPRERLESPILPVADVPAASPRAILTPEPPAPARPTAQSPIVATPGHTSLDIVLVDALGRGVSLSYVDGLWLTKTDQQPGEPYAWQLAVDDRGHITTPDLPPGRYAGTLHTGIAGDIRRSDLVVTADQQTRVEFRYAGLPLEQRIAVRIQGLARSGPYRPRIQDLVLHGAGGSTHMPSDAGDNVFLFDGLATGRYDLELRRDGKEPRWLHGLAPGMLREEWLDLGGESAQEFNDTLFTGR